jgi:prolyl-tRNA synthetase
MRWSQTLIPTLRQVPAEAVVPSHQLMLRAGYIQQVASGTYTYLPLGLRSLQKAMTIVREEMDRAGAIEVLMPALQPVEWWERTGRREAYGENLFVLEDRHGREQALGPTHEEVTTQLVGHVIESYRQLPVTLYQIQTKFRDEFRPRFGVLRSREFQMKDAYSFDLTLEGLDESYQKMFDAYCRIFERCGIPYVTVEAESGPIGGSASHEFMVPSPTGEDTILSSDKGNYAANVEKCETGDRTSDLTGEPTGELEDLHTPGCPGIDDVIDYCKRELKTKIKKQNMLKCLVFVATAASDSSDPREATDPWYVLAIVRSDHEVNEAKIRELMSDKLGPGVNLLMAPDDLAKQDGWAIGYVGPHAAAGRDDTHLLIDPDAAQPGFWVTGGNEADHHVKHFNWKRDVTDVLAADAAERMQIADIRNAVAGDPSPRNDGGVLVESKGIEIGHVFKLGCKYTESMDISVADENQQAVKPIMGCYGIGVNRILAAGIERETGHDDNGIIWPMALAPFQVVITPIKYAPGSEVADTCDKLYDDLTQRGIDVLLDDRDERPGPKFKDADLIGIPIRLVVGDKGLANGEVEFKRRTADKPEMVALDAVVERTAEAIAEASA